MSRQRRWGEFPIAMVFIAPSLIILTLFLLGPLAASFYISLTNWDLLNAPHFIGIANYLELVRSPDERSALFHTLFFIVGYLPIVLVLGLGLALLLNRPLRGVQVYRAAFFMPVVSSWVAVSLMWKWILNPAFGLVNFLLGLAHLPQPGWWADPHWAMPAVIVASICPTLRP